MIHLFHSSLLLPSPYITRRKQLCTAASLVSKQQPTCRALLLLALVSGSVCPPCSVRHASQTLSGQRPQFRAKVRILQEMELAVLLCRQRRLARFAHGGGQDQSIFHVCPATDTETARNTAQRSFTSGAKTKTSPFVFVVPCQPSPIQSSKTTLQQCKTACWINCASSLIGLFEPCPVGPPPHLFTFFSRAQSFRLRLVLLV